MTQKRILIVDDEKRQRNNMKDVLGASYQIIEAGNLDQAKARSQKEPPDLILLDVMLGDIDSVKVLQEGNASFQAPIVLVTGRRGEALREQIVSEENEGKILDFLYKPYSADELLAVVTEHMGEAPPPDNARESLEGFKDLENLKSLKANYDEKYDKTSAIVCACNAMVRVKEHIRAFSESDIIVLVRGATGTGKELVAREIHRLRSRRKRPFVPVNCSAIPEALLESELFGHEKGAFTGAVSAKPGLFEQADGGTIFLDEIGEMLPLTQTKVLRILEENKVMRLGGIKHIPVDVRIITATNRDLEATVKAGKFRADLYYRIKVAEIFLPPLRQRGDDVLLLIEHFLREAERHPQKYGIDEKTAQSETIGISKAALRLLRAYSWLGNVRELEHTIARAVALTRMYGDVITEEHLDEHVRRYDDISLSSEDDIWSAIDAVVNKLNTKNLTKDEIEGYASHFRCSMYHRVLQANGGNKARTVRQLGVGEAFFKQGAYQRWWREREKLRGS